MDSVWYVLHLRFNKHSHYIMLNVVLCPFTKYKALLQITLACYMILCNTPVMMFFFLRIQEQVFHCKNLI